MKIFKATAGLVSIIAMLAAMPAMAQTANSNSNSGSNANSGSASSSRAQTGPSSANTNANQTQGTNVGTSSGANLTFNSTTSPNTTTSNTDRVTGGTTNSNSNTGFTSSDNIVRTTPTVYAPPVSGGNPCTLAVSGGVSVIGWGAAAGGTFVDQDCANRQKIAMVWNSGLKDIAFELMCNDRDTYNAAKSTASGPRCAFRQQFEPAGAAAQPVAPPAPAPLGPTVQRTSTTAPPPFQPAGRFACLDMHGREVKAGTPGASCGQI